MCYLSAILFSIFRDEKIQKIKFSLPLKKMTLIFIKNLGITRLREVAKILKIPGYTLYDDPNALRSHIMKFLTKQYYVRQKHLDKIGKTQAEVDMLVKHLRSIAKEYKKRQSSPLKRSMISLVSRLQECQGVCPEDVKAQLPADVSSKLNIASVSKKTFPLIEASPVGLSVAPSLSPLAPVESGSAAMPIVEEGSLEEAKKQLYAEKVQAIKDLEEAQRKIELYQGEVKRLDKVLGTTSSLEDISSALTKILQLQTELSVNLESVKTQETIIAALRAQIGDKNETPTVFEKESNGMIDRVQQLDQKTQTLMQEVARHVKTIEEQQKVIDEQKNAITEQDQAMQPLNIENEQNVAKIKAQVNEIQQCNVSLQDCNQKLEVLQQRIELLSKELGEQKFNAGKLEAENKRFEQQLQTVAYGDEKELGQMKKYVGEMMGYLSRAIGKIARLEGVPEDEKVKNGLEKLRGIKSWPAFKLSFDELSGEITRLRNAAKNTEVKGENAEQIKTLRETLVDANAKVAQLEEQIKQMRLQDSVVEQKVATVELGQPPALVPPTQIPVVQQPQQLQFPNQLPQPPPRDPGWFGFFRRQPKEEDQSSPTDTLVQFDSQEMSPQPQQRGWFSWFGSGNAAKSTNPAGVDMRNNPYDF